MRENQTHRYWEWETVPQGPLRSAAMKTGFVPAMSPAQTADIRTITTAISPGLFPSRSPTPHRNLEERSHRTRALEGQACAA